MKKLLQSESKFLPCVYKITINNKIYIGSTKNAYVRERQHYSSLIKNKHYNVIMQRTYNKYKNFNFEVLCYLENQEIKTILFIEKYFINLYKPILNITKDPYSPSEADRKRISEKIKLAYAEKRLINPWHKKGRNVNIYDIFGKILYENVSTENAVELIKISNRSVINNSIRTKIYLVNNYIVTPTNVLLEDILKETLKLNKKGYSYFIIKSNSIQKICLTKSFQKKVNDNNFVYLTSKGNLIFKKGYLYNALFNRNIRLSIEELSKELLTYLDEDNLNRRVELTIYPGAEHRS